MGAAVRPHVGDRGRNAFEVSRWSQADKRKACPQMGKNLSVRVNLKNLYQEQKRLINFLKLRNLRAKVFFNF